jgi:hypothetical protein
MADIMAQMRALTDRVAAGETENERLKAALKEAQETGAFTDEFGQKVVILDRNMEGVNAGMHDKPGTIPEILDVMEKQAKMRREKFDRPRTEAILRGEEVQDLSEYICDRCGRSEERWAAHPELFDAHVEHHITGKAQAYRGAKKVRRVDAEDDEDAERAVLARLQEKYGIVRETDSGLAIAR